MAKQKTLKQRYNRRYSDLKYEVKKAYRKVGSTISPEQLERMLGPKLSNPEIEDYVKLYEIKPSQIIPDFIKEANKQIRNFERTGELPTFGLEQEEFSEIMDETMRWLAQANWGTASASIDQFFNTLEKYEAHGEVLKTFMSELLGEYDIDTVGSMLAEASYAGLEPDYETMYDKDSMARYMTNMMDFLSDRGASFSNEARASINEALDMSFNF